MKSRPLVILAIALVVACCSSPTSPTTLPSREPLATSSGETAGPPPSPSAGPSQRPVLAWSQTATIPSPIGLATGTITDVVGFAGGYVAITRTRTVWFSVDGQTWTPSVLPFTRSKDRTGNVLDADVQAVATDGTRVLVVGGYSHGPCLWAAPGAAGGGPACPLAPLAWTSTDGRTWRNDLPGPRPPDPASYEQGSEFTAAWPVPSGGWDAALSFWKGESLEGNDLWHSGDAIDWVKLRPAPAVDTGDAYDAFPLVHEGVANASGQRVLWQGWMVYSAGNGTPLTTLATSPDGLTWTSIHDFPGKDARVNDGVAPATGGTGSWVLVGGIASTDPATGMPTGVPTAWTSPDSTHWTANPLPTTAYSSIIEASSVVLARAGYVAVGTWTNGLQSDQATWVSADGATWTLQARLASGQALAAPRFVADGPAGVLGIGWDADFSSVVWLLRAP